MTMHVYCYFDFEHSMHWRYCTMFLTLCVYQPHCHCVSYRSMEGFYPKLNALLYVHVHVYFSAFQSGGVDLSQPIVFTCGGAMVAPLVAFSLHLTGLSAPVYDVSYELLYYSFSMDTLSCRNCAHHYTKKFNARSNKHNI